MVHITLVDKETAKLTVADVWNLQGTPPESTLETFAKEVEHCAAVFKDPKALKRKADSLEDIWPDNKKMMYDKFNA